MKRIQRILVPTDFSTHAARAAEFAIELSKEFGASIHLLHCYPVNVGAASLYGMTFPVELEASIRKVAQKQLGDWREKVAGEGVEAELSLSPQSPAQGILALAEEIGADLIVMGTRGRSGLKHLLLGSVAERVVREASCPVVTLRSPDAASSD